MNLSDYVELNPRVPLVKGQLVPFISMDVITPGSRWVWPEEERPATGSGSKFAPGDTLFARITPCLENGKIAQFLGHHPGMGSTEFIVLRARHNISDPAFVYYFAQNRELRSAAEKSMSGASGRQRANISALRDFECEFPALPVQRRIAGILSAYDELMENNRRRIRILEGMARALYREWFVHFRIPADVLAKAGASPKIKRVDSPLGPIPHSWEVKPLESLITAQIGGGWGKEAADEDHTEPAWVIRGTDIPDARCCRVANVPHRFHTVSNLRSRRLQASDILFEVSGGSKGQPVGRTLLVTPELLSAFGGDDVICASFCKRVCPDTSGYGAELLYLSFLEGYESGEIEQFQVQSTGISNFKWTEYIAQTRRVVPPTPLRKRFSEHVAPMFSQIATLGLQTVNLRQTRDLLLPRLLSGGVNLIESNRDILLCNPHPAITKPTTEEGLLC
jgi:type I restriction enzyme S subunit